MKKDIKDKVVLITGVSTGLGRQLAIKLLEKGAKVAGTLRREDQIAAFESLSPEGNALGIKLDITDGTAVRSGVEKVVRHFGRIDVLSNNAGAGTVGAIEETNIEEAQHIFDVNFFGGLRMIHAVLPHMRSQRSGHVLQFSAIGGFTGVPGLGVYAAAKGATDILGEALVGELKPLGIDVTVLTIGIFHTNFAGGSLKYTQKQIEDYNETPAGKFRGFIGGLQGKQPNDARKGAEAIINIMQADEPPVHAPLGVDASGVMRKKIERLNADIKTWETNAASTAIN